MNYTRLLGADRIERGITASILGVYLLITVATLSYILLCTDCRSLDFALLALGLWGMLTLGLLALARKRTESIQTGESKLLSPNQIYGGITHDKKS
jgi:hypothetical protein